MAELGECCKWKSNGLQSCDIKVITPTAPHEIGYYVGKKKFNLAQDTIDYIDTL